MRGIFPGVSLANSWRHALAVSLAATLLGSILVVAPAPMAAGATPPSVSITGFPEQAITGDDHSFSINLLGFTESDSDVDRVFQVAMSVSEGNGTLTLASTTGISESPGQQRSGAATIRFTGTLSAVNAAMTDMEYQPDSTGAVTLSVSASHIPAVIPGADHDTVFIADLPVKWEESDGGNGHYYQYLKTTSAGKISWTEAKAASAARTLLGQPGYLATLTTAEENSFVANEIDAPSIWIGASDDRNQIVISGTETLKYADQPAAEGKWHWVTGPESGTQFMDANAGSGTPPEGHVACGTSGRYEGITTADKFSGWACGEPNNASHTIDSITSTENFAVTNWSNTVGTWNDLPFNYGSVIGFLVEYSGFSAPESAQATANTSAITTPEAPSISSITAGNGSLTVAVTTGATGGSPITNFEYSTDNGATYQAFSPAVTSGPLTIGLQSAAGNPAVVNGTAYSVRIKAVNAAGASDASDSTSATPVASKPAAPVISSVTAGDRRLTVAFSISDNGGEAVTSVEYQLNGGDFQAFSTTTSPGIITGLTNGQAYTIVIRATNVVGASDNSASATGTPVRPPAPATNPPATNPPAVIPPTTPPPGTNGSTSGTTPGQTSSLVTPPAALPGPLPSINGNGGQAPSAPNGSIGGTPTSITTNVVGGNQMNMQAGSSSFGVAVPQGQGQVNSGQNGDAELSVQAGASTQLSGSGLLPGSMVQIFMPLGGNGSLELGQITVGPTGLFSGDAVFASRPSDPPFPIGRHVMQIVSVNSAGERVIVEMAINIAQPSPQPSIVRSTGQIPTLTPGQSFATRAGEPTDVSLVVDEQASTTQFQGDGWSFTIDVSGAGNQVSETPDGGALLNVVRGGETTISGDGFMPLTRIDIWLFSDPTLMGSVELDENGEFTGTVTIDGLSVPVGEHTLQIQGVGADGFVLAANLGVVVSDPVDGAAVAGTIGASATLLWWVSAVFLLVALLVVAWLLSTRRNHVRQGRPVAVGILRPSV